MLQFFVHVYFVWIVTVTLVDKRNHCAYSFNVTYHHQNRKLFLKAWFVRCKQLLHIHQNGEPATNIDWLDENEIKAIILDNGYKSWLKHTNQTKTTTGFDEYPALSKDIVFNFMKTHCVSSQTAINRIAFPLEFYLSETQFRIYFFEWMKSLAHISFNNIKSFQEYMNYKHHIPAKNKTISLNFIDAAWALMVAIKLIRTCEVSTKVAFSSDVGILKNSSLTLWPSIAHIPLQYYHGAVSDPKNYFKTKNNYVESIAAIDAFEFVYRSVWIHSTTIDFETLKHPSNFNSWSLQLSGALSVAEHFLSIYSDDIANTFKYLVILVAPTDWNYIQSVRKWYSCHRIAASELEVITPPFMKYNIGTINMITNKTFEKYFRPLCSIYNTFLHKPLPRDQVMLVNTQMTGPTWKNWFETMDSTEYTQLHLGTNLY